MENWVFLVLKRKLIKFASDSKMDIFRDDKLFFILRNVNHYIIIPRHHIGYFLKVYFVDCQTYKILRTYKTNTNYYKPMLRKIRFLNKRLNTIKIEH